MTKRGGGLLAAGTLGLAAGLALGSWSASALGIALLLALAVAWIEGEAPSIQVVREPTSAILTEGGRTRVVLHVQTPRRRRALIEEEVPPGLHIVQGLPRADATIPTKLEYEVEARTPGRWRLGPLRVRVTDPLKLVEETWTISANERISVYPRLDALRDVPLRSRLSLPLAGSYSTGQAGLGSDFYALRAYQQGDTMRTVNWRASARTGKGLVVNQREKESQATVTFFVDARAIGRVGTPTQNAWVESIRAFAALAAHAARRRDRPRLVLYGERVHGPTSARSGDAALTSLLDPLLDLPPTGSIGLAAAVEQVAPLLRPKAPVVIISALLEDESVPFAITSLRSLEQNVTVIAIDPSQHLAASGSPASGIERTLAERTLRIEALRARGGHVIPWDPSEPLAIALAREARP
ncbi:MAG: DUF58 domain-containing protein [Candidatus Thermoplasmatota archaeon]